MSRNLCSCLAQVMQKRIWRMMLLDDIWPDTGVKDEFIRLPLLNRSHGICFVRPSVRMCSL